MVEIEPIQVEIEREEDGRMLASVPDLPGVMAYGVTSDEAIRKLKAIALQVLADMAPRVAELTFSFHDGEEVGPAALSKIAKSTGLSPGDL